jgi:cytochrome c oxidase subunit 3
VPDAVHVVEPFAAPQQQREATFLGMWLFIATEAMLFGGLFMTILVYRYLHPAGAHEAVDHLRMLLGGVNTGVLLTSSFGMAVAVAAAHAGARRLLLGTLPAVAVLGLAFIAIKGFEYRLEYSEGLMPGLGPPSPLSEPGAQLFLNLYFAATGLHAIHLAIGIVLVAGLWLGVFWRRPRFEHGLTVQMIGIYWHFVDVVWVFLYPALYLIGR